MINDIPHKDLEDQKAEDDGKRPSDFVDKPKKNIFKKIIKGQTAVGKVLGIGLDIITIVAPAGSKIDKIRSKAKQALNVNETHNEMKSALKRAFTADGGGFIRVRNKDGKLDKDAIIASAIRMAILIGGLWLANIAGVLDYVAGFLGLG